MKRLGLRTLGLAIATATALTLGACASPTPYQPFQPGGMNAGGFSEYRISDNRFRVSFQGNTLTERETVERYLLYRAAELTVQTGYDWFEMVDRDTDTQIQRSRVPVTDTYYAWTPTWYRLEDGRWVMTQTLEPYFYTRYESSSSTRFQAEAEIFLRRGSPSPDDSRAFNAREVLANLGPSIRYPETAG